MTNYFPFQVSRERLKRTFKSNGQSLKNGFVKIEFLDCRNENNKPDFEIYHCSNNDKIKFEQWAKQEFGYLRYVLIWGN